MLRALNLVGSDEWQGVSLTVVSAEARSCCLPLARLLGRLRFDEVEDFGVVGILWPGESTKILMIEIQREVPFDTQPQDC